MPEMDGIEAAQKIRRLGYKGAIVALTASVSDHDDGTFLHTYSGFDEAMPKPIDERRLEEVLNKFLPEKVRAESVPAAGDPSYINPRFFEVFCRDAEKAIVKLRKTLSGGDLKLYATTAHAMKSALAIIGELEISKQALALEKAGREGDTGFINDNNENFIAALSGLIKKFAPNESADVDDKNIIEDTGYLIEQLRIVKSACENYDDTAAYQALDKLKEKVWKKSTAQSLEKIRHSLYLHSDFKGVVNIVNGMVS
jgi:HPt (histidine-containing phosphotransfer) domain-containing protein